MVYKKSFYVLVITCLVLFGAVADAQQITEIQVKSVSPDMQQGQRGPVRITFTGPFDVNKQLFNPTVNSGAVEILSVTIVNSVPVASTAPPPADPQATQTPPPSSTTQNYDVTMELLVKVKENANPGNVRFEIPDGSGAKVVGFLRIVRNENKLSSAKPAKVESGNNQVIEIYSNGDIPSSMILKSDVNQPGCTISQAQVVGDHIKITISIPKSAEGKFLNFGFRIGNENEYAYWYGERLVKVQKMEPKLIQVNPKNIEQGASKETIKIFGANFVKGAKISFSNRDIAILRKKVLNKKHIALLVNVKPDAKLGGVDVMVETPDGKDLKRNMFEIVPGPPKIIRMEPSSVELGTKNANFKVYGKNFSKDTRFRFGGRGVNITDVRFINDGQVILRVNVGPEANPGYRGLMAVKTKTARDTKRRILEVKIPKIELKKVTPNNAEQGEVNVELTLEGKYFLDNFTVKFSSPGITIKNVRKISDTMAKVVVDIDENTLPNKYDILMANATQMPTTFSRMFTVTKKQYKNKLALVHPGLNCESLVLGEIDMKEYSSKGIVDTLYPTFQWESNALTYTFLIFTPKAGQTELSEIISGYPLYEVKRLTKRHFTYPLAARELKPGSKYYWQIIGHFEDNTLESEVYCFEVSKLAKEQR